MTGEWGNLRKAVQHARFAAGKGCLAGRVSLSIRLRSLVRSKPHGFRVIGTKRSQCGCHWLGVLAYHLLRRLNRRSQWRRGLDVCHHQCLLR
jgi:hypothetical protein